MAVLVTCKTEDDPINGEVQHFYGKIFRCYNSKVTCPIHPNIEHDPHLSLVVRKPAFCICENKEADELRRNHKADQRIRFCYTDSTIPLLSKSEISSL